MRRGVRVGARERCMILRRARRFVRLANRRVSFTAGVAMSKMRFLIAAAAATLAVTAFAHGKPDEAVDYRMGLMTVVEWNFSPLGEMVKGKIAFDAAEFAKRAQRIANVSDQLVEGFPKGSDKNAHSDAKAAIWAHFDDFSEKAKTFDTEAKALADVAKGKDEAKDREQFRKLADACKACHEKYKND
jgi:cytochrome c556